MNRRIGRKRQKKKKKKKRIEIKKWVVIVLAEFGGFCLGKKKKKVLKLILLDQSVRNVRPRVYAVAAAEVLTFYFFG